MPEIKHTFTAGRMNKDLDPRLVPNGEYRDALDIEVKTNSDAQTSDGEGNVGTVRPTPNPNWFNLGGVARKKPDNHMVIASIADDKTNKSYWFLASEPFSVPVTGFNFGFDMSVIGNGMYFRDMIVEVNSGTSTNDISESNVDFVVVDYFAAIESWEQFYGDGESGYSGNYILPSGSFSEIECTNASRYRVGMQVDVYGSANTSGSGAYTEIIFSSEIIALDTSSNPNKIILGDTVDLTDTFNDGTTIGVAGLVFRHPDRVLNFKSPTDAQLAQLSEGSYVFTFGSSSYENITGINIIDNLLFWTDNYGEPKKINIDRCKAGTNQDQYSPPGIKHTQLMVTDPKDGEFTKVIAEGSDTNLENGSISVINDLREEHVTVLRRAPRTAPTLEMSKTDRLGNTSANILNFGFFTTISYSGAYTIDNPVATGDVVIIPGSQLSTATVDFSETNFILGDIITFTQDDDSSDSPIVIKAKFETYIDQNGDEVSSPAQYAKFTLLTVDSDVTTTFLDWKAELELRKPLFETKFGRFGYRYKYEDGEYSAFSPWSELAFLPGEFDYIPKKGYNLGMENNVRHLVVKDFLPLTHQRPLDVVSVDVLFKTTESPNVYVVKTITREVDPEWEYFTPGSSNSSLQTGKLIITSEMIHRTLPSNQLLRAWDNVPRYAKAQEIVGNRVVYGNYTQGYNLDFKLSVEPSIYSSQTATPQAPEKSLKSIRDYKFGIVLGDRYGRETPIIESSLLAGDNSNNWSVSTGDVTVDKQLASMKNCFNIAQDWTFENTINPPSWVDYAKYYIKETSNEYYNLVMDRWYDAGDGNIWMSFNSADRNKVDEETYLILKNANGSHTPIKEKARYKILAIENEAPDYIKSDRRTIGEITLNPETSNLFTGTINTETLAPTNLMTATYIQIPNSEWEDLLKDYQKRGDLRMRFLGRTFDSGGELANEQKTAWVTISNYSNADQDDTIAGNETRIYWNEPFNQSINMFQRFTDLGYDLNTTSGNNDLKYILEIREDVLENKPEFDGRFFVKIETDVTIEEQVMLLSPDNSEWEPFYDFQIGFVSSQLSNPALNGPYSSGTATQPEMVKWGGSMDETGATVGEWAAVPFSTSYGQDPTMMALGCLQYQGADSGDFLSSGADNIPGDWSSVQAWGKATKKYWEMRNSYSNYIFIDEARAAQWWWKVGGQLGGNASNDYLTNTLGIADPTQWQQYYYEDDYDWSLVFYQMLGINSYGQSGGSGKYYRPRGIDATPELLTTTSPDAQGTKNRVVFSYVTYQWNEDDSSEGIFKNRMSWGNHFRFSGSTDIYKIIGTRDETEDDTGLPNHGTRNYRQQFPANMTSGGYQWSGGGGEGTGATGEWVYWETLTGDQSQVIGQMPYGLNDWQAFPWNGSTNNPNTGNPNKDYIPTWGDGMDNVLVRANCANCDSENGTQCTRHSIRVTFAKIDPSTGQVYDDLRGIDLNEYDPRGRVRHDGTTTMGLQIVKRISTGGGVLESPENAACWETEPKEDVDLDLYYEASNALPITLNKKNSLAYAPINSKVFIERGLIDNSVSVVSTYNVNDSGGFEDTFNAYVSDVKYDSDHSIIDLKSYETVTSPTPVQQSGGISVGDMMIFKHSDGTETRSKITDNYQEHSSGAVFPVERRQVSLYLNGSIPSIPSLISLSSPSTDLVAAVNGTQIVSALTSSGNIVNVPGGVFLRNFGYNDDAQVWDLQLTNTDWMEVGTTYVTWWSLPTGLYKIDSDVYKYKVKLGWFNCYSFGNGVESDRVRDDYNAPQIDNGVKVSTTFSGYGEENKSSGLIYSGLYNSISEVNNSNEFNMAEKITKDLNPAYGSIQTLKTRDTDIVTFCEDKVLKILANKDAVYNADGNPQLTATDRVLGTAIPFVGDYGISKNPESLAVDQFRMYFTDVERGAVLRLSRDGLTPISNVGMKAWFRENLKGAKRAIGSFDTVKGEYNLTINRAYGDGEFFNTNSEYIDTISFSESSKGWVSFKSFYASTALSLNDKYLLGYESHVGEGYKGLYSGESSITMLFNDMPGSMKSFHTVNYEGSQSRITAFTTEETEDAAGNTWSNNDGNYHNLNSQNGWYVSSFNTNAQEGHVPEFKEKEDKWFSQIQGVTTNISNLDSKEFSVQGIGKPYEAGCQPQYISLTYVQGNIDEGEAPVWVLKSKCVPAGTIVKFDLVGPNSTINIRYDLSQQTNFSNAGEWSGCQPLSVSIPYYDENDGTMYEGGLDYFYQNNDGQFNNGLYDTFVNGLKNFERSVGTPWYSGVSTNLNANNVSSDGFQYTIVQTGLECNSGLPLQDGVTGCAGWVITEDLKTEGVEYIECVLHAEDSAGNSTLNAQGNQLSSIISINDTSVGIEPFTFNVSGTT
jgi:hypothetical protein